MTQPISRLAMCPQSIGDGVTSLAGNHDNVPMILLKIFPQVFEAGDCYDQPMDLLDLVNYVSQKTNVRLTDIIYFHETSVRQISFFFGSNIGRLLAPHTEIKCNILQELRFGKFSSIRVFTSYESRTKQLGLVFSSSIFQAVRRSTLRSKCECEIMSLRVPKINLLSLPESEEITFEKGCKYSSVTKSFTLRNDEDVQYELLMQISVDFSCITPAQEYLYGPYGNSNCF
jgi:hypothetical protein